MAGDALPDLIDWRETYAYSLGLQAYVFGFPYVHLPTVRWSWVTQPKADGTVAPYAALNHFHHIRHLADARHLDGGSPNNDMLCSAAWVDVSRAPVIFSHPEMGDRYFSFEFASLDSDNFAYVGSRTTGSAPGRFAIVPPGWNGQLPMGVAQLPPSRTGSVLVFGRTYVRGPSDEKVVHVLQDGLSLVPLSYWGQPADALPHQHEAWKPYDSRDDGLAEWKTMNRAMTEDPPEARLAPLLSLFAEIHVGPGQNIDALDTYSKRGLERAARDGRALLSEAMVSGLLGKRVNNWNVPASEFGRAGLTDRFLLRSAMQCLGSIIGNDPEEAVYFDTALDAEGHVLDGERQYRLRFAPGQMPRVDAFWSLSLYDANRNFAPNPIDRYAIGQRTDGLRLDPDGGLTIQIQGELPAGDRKSNWLPSPRRGGYSLILRTYVPGPEIVRGNWGPPPVVRVG